TEQPRVQAAQPRNIYGNQRQSAPAPAPAPVHNAAPGFLFGDDSANVVQAKREEITEQPAPAPAPAPAPQPVQVQPMQQVQPYGTPRQAAPVAPAPAAPQNQMGGRPQANVTPQQAPDQASAAPKSAKPWFMFGRESE
ncbi:MAG TPA: hypothetical protein DCW41_06950, partial [Clostridiales bacterium]|nr:hypothetical protein [Clostridiales bacterium]